MGLNFRDICIRSHACRPGLDLSQEPPAVRMNDELGGILTYKLKVCLHIYLCLSLDCCLTHQLAAFRTAGMMLYNKLRFELHLSLCSYSALTKQG